MVRLAVLPCLALAAGCVGGAGSHRAGREVVRLWHPWTADGAAIVQRIADRFNASQGRYEAVPLSVPGTEEAKTKFMLSVAGGDPPDLVATWDPVLPLYARDGVVQPLDGLMSPADRAAYGREYPVARRAGRYRGRVYGLCVGLNVPGVYYLPATMRQAGLPDRPPQTLEELAEWGARLDRRDAEGNLRRWGLDPGYLRDLAPLFGDVADGSGRVDTPANVAALRWIVAGRRRAGFQAVQRFQLGIGIDVASKSAEASWPFMSGRYGMAVDGQWRVHEAAQAAPEFARLYRTAPLPPRSVGPRGTGFATATLLTLPSGARHRAGAWAFARFWSGLADPKAAAAMNVLGGWLPSGPEMAAAPAYREYVRLHPQFEAFMRTIAQPGLQTHPPVPDQAYVYDALDKAETFAVAGDETPEAALREAQRRIDHERARRRDLGEAL